MIIFIRHARTRLCVSPPDLWEKLRTNLNTIMVRMLDAMNEPTRHRHVSLFDDELVKLFHVFSAKIYGTNNDVCTQIPFSDLCHTHEMLLLLMYVCLLHFLLANTDANILKKSEKTQSHILVDIWIQKIRSCFFSRGTAEFISLVRYGCCMRCARS